MSEAANAPEGRVIESRYRIVSKIADGGMATVYRAVDERLERTVAIKIMHTQLAQGPHRDQFVERFHREAKSAAAIANPHIVQVYDTGEVDGLDFLVMEYVHGVNLRHEMNRQTTFPVRETLRIVMETLDGLASAHRAGVVHRDIKPENILLNDRGHVQITDFGLAKAASQATLSSTGMLLGTAAYLAPEMIENNEATPQGDLYSVGIMAWEMLTGQVPFISDNPVTLVFKHVHEDVPSVATLCPGIDPAVAGFVAHLAARAVDARPADASVALEELRALAPALTPEALQYRKPAESDDSATANDGSHIHVERTSAMAGAIPIPTPPARPTAPVSSTGIAADGQQAATTAMPVAPSTTATVDMDATRTISQPTAASPNVTAPNGADPNATVAINVAPQAEATQAIGLDTAMVDTADTAALGDMPSMKMVDTAAPKPRKRGRTALIVTLVVLLVAACGGGGGAWWYYLGPGSYWSLPKPSDVTCVENTPCALTGANWKDYASTLNVAGIPYDESEDFSDDVPAGQIVDANVDGQSALVDGRVSKRRSQRLTVIVSKGVRMATIPADILDPASEAGKAPLDALKTAGFDNVKHDEAADQWSETLPAGAAISVTPEAGSELKHNDEVTVVLSKGPMPVNMPDIVGRNKDEAAQALAELKLKANYAEEFSDTVAAGNVISASVAKDTQLHWGDSVDVVVSKGPQMVTVPDVRGQNYDDAVKTLKALGLEVKKSAPLGDWTNQVRLQDPAPGQQVRLRGADGKATVITLTVV